MKRTASREGRRIAGEEELLQGKQERLAWRDGQADLAACRDKKTARQRAAALRSQLSAEARARFSLRIVERFVRQPFFADHTLFFIYCSYLSEVETPALLRLCLRAEKRLAVPLIVKKNTGHLDICAIAINDPATELDPGYRGIPEPLASGQLSKSTVDPREIEVAVLPGLAFDRNGNRLGYGGGCYDRFLDRWAPRAIRVGLAFSCQVVEALPVEVHDVPLHFLLTEQECLVWPRAAR